MGKTVTCLDPLCGYVETPCMANGYGTECEICDGPVSVDGHAPRFPGSGASYAAVKVWQETVQRFLPEGSKVIHGTYGEARVENFGINRDGSLTVGVVLGDGVFVDAELDEITRAALARSTGVGGEG